MTIAIVLLVAAVLVAAPVVIAVIGETIQYTVETLKEERKKK